MSAGLNLLSELWRARKDLVLPTLLMPMVMAGYSLSQPPNYTATALLQVDTAHAKSPLLQGIDQPGNGEALNRMLHGQSLLQDTAHDAGMRLDPRRITLRVVNDKLIEIGYSSPQEMGLEGVVDALATNFIYEVLAPERLRVEQRLGDTGQKLTAVKTRLASPEGAADYPRLKLEEQALTTQYGELMTDLSAVNAAFDKSSPGGLIWFAEPARTQPASTPAAKVEGAVKVGVGLGLLLGLVLVAVRHWRPRGVASVEVLGQLTQLPLAGSLPDMGPVQVSGGKAHVALGQTVLNPVDFTETTRLHRALTRQLHGALVLTSTVGGEGTSMLATLLALKSAASDKRTLLVDLNLKNGWVTKAFGLSAKDWDLAPVKPSGKPTRGASKGFAMADVIARGAGAGGLDVLPLPADKTTLDMLATSGGAAALFDGLSSAYEHIVVDTTPMLAHNRHNADPVLLAAAANRTALVVLMRRTPANLAQQAAEQLSASGAHVVGVIANNLYNPSARVLLMDMARTLGKVAPGLASWLRAKVSVSGVE